MEGGVAIILLVVLLVVGGGIAIMLYLTGGALAFRKDREQGGESRPEHKYPTSPTQEKTELAGVHHDGDDENRR